MIMINDKNKYSQKQDMIMFNWQPPTLDGFTRLRKTTGAELCKI